VSISKFNAEATKMAVQMRENRQKLQKFFICKWWTFEKNFTEQKVFKIDQRIRCNFFQNFLRRFYIFQIWRFCVTCTFFLLLLTSNIINCARRQCYLFILRNQCFCSQWV